MIPQDDGPKFQKLIPTLRGNYAFLKCGRFIMQMIFLWIQERQDIQNVEAFLLNEAGLTNTEYKKYFTSTTRDVFKRSGIRDIDITAIFRMHQTVHGFCKDVVQSWSELEYLLTKFKDERNEIMHTLLIKDKIQNEVQLNEYLNNCGNLVDNVLRAFQDLYPGYASEQQKMEAKEFVRKVLDEVRNSVHVSIQHYGTGDLNIPEDIAAELHQRIITIAGQRGSLSIEHHGSGNINISHDVYHITGGTTVINI